MASFLSSPSRESSFTASFSKSLAFATMTSLPPISFSRANSCSPASCGSTLLTNCFRFGERVGWLLPSLRSYINTLQSTLPWKQEKRVSLDHWEKSKKKKSLKFEDLGASVRSTLRFCPRFFNPSCQAFPVKFQVNPSLRIWRCVSCYGGR